MATFPSYKPTYSANKRSEPRIRTAQFGDGYQERVTFGINQNPKQWSLTFNVSDTDADVIETFLNDRAVDCASFDWTPPDTTTSYKWICPNWDREMFDIDRSRITVTFQQVFEP